MPFRYSGPTMAGKQTSEYTLGFLALLLGAVAIGFAPIFVRLSEVDPSANAFWRVALAFPFFFIWAGLQKGESDKAMLRKPTDYRGLFVGGLLFALDLAFWHWSLQFTTVANATLLSNLMPVVVAVGAVWLFGEHFRNIFWIGLGFAILGAALLAGGSIGKGRLLGDGLAVITAIFYGAYILSISRLRLQFRTTTIMIWTGVFSAILLIPISFLTEDRFFPHTIDGWLIILGLAFVCQFLGQGLIAYALKHLPSAFGAVTLLLQPIVAAAAAWVLFGETLGLYDYAGAMAILTGITLAKFGTDKARSS